MRLNSSFYPELWTIVEKLSDTICFPFGSLIFLTARVRSSFLNDLLWDASALSIFLKCFAFINVSDPLF